MNKAEKIALKRFKDAAKNVPAYKDFLSKNKVDPSKINSIEDFSLIPAVDKENYLRKYPLEQLSNNGDLFTSQMISVSSGSSGEPFHWYRTKAQDEEGVKVHERILVDIFGVDKKKTLVVVCFSMGTWVAGTYTTSSVLGVAVNDKYKINVITPGLEQKDAIKSIQAIGDHYDQIVITGYPPFVKDLLDLGENSGINWQKKDVKFLFAGESISEEWRDYVLHKVGSKNTLFDAVNIYGTADAALIGHETPLSTFIRRYINDNKISKEVFNTDILPTLVQYYPERTFFEEEKGEIVFSADAGIPLIRYNIHDHGGVHTFKDLTSQIQKITGKPLKISKNLEKWKNMPFVHIKGRKDLTVTLYGLNVYPENIKVSLIDKRVVDYCSGKFVMRTEFKSDMDQYLDIKIEIKPDMNVERGLEKKLTNIIVENLKQYNAEYRKLYASVGEKRATPRVHIVKPDGNSFVKGPKYKWMEKINGKG